MNFLHCIQCQVCSMRRLDKLNFNTLLFPLLFPIGTSYLLVFQYFSHGLIFLETSHMTFPTKVIVQNEGRQRLQLEERLFQNIEGTDDKQLCLCVSKSQTFFCTLAFSPINHHMKRFFGFDALRLNICQKAFCERIMLQLSLGPLARLRYSLVF